tara:strand:+ start:12416 stop:12685 length:270 start_codon:yes stop_codon:yes gene_type:complete
MTDIKPNRVSVKDMNEEQKKEHRRKQNREYQAKKRLDPEFAEKQRQLMRNYRQTEKYKEYNKKHCAENYQKTKDTIRDLKLRVQILEGY